MNIKSLAKAKAEAQRFLNVASHVVVVESRFIEGPNRGKRFRLIEQPSKASAACLRASMDLTRALAEMRHSLNYGESVDD